MEDYIIQSADEINKLKQDLMDNKDKTYTISTKNMTKSIDNSKHNANNNEHNNNNDEKIRKIESKEIRRILNERIGFVFEDNIRGTLEYEYVF